MHAMPSRWPPQTTLAEAYPNRFLLGLGVSHAPLVEQLRGHRYEKPVATMRGLFGCHGSSSLPIRFSFNKALPYSCGAGAEDAETVWRTRQRSASLQREHTEHTALAPDIGTQTLSMSRASGGAGDGSWQGTADRARISWPLFALPNYANNFLRLGFDESDFKDGGSDRLIDAIIAWGDLDTDPESNSRAPCGWRGPRLVPVLTADPRRCPCGSGVNSRRPCCVLKRSAKQVLLWLALEQTCGALCRGNGSVLDDGVNRKLSCGRAKVSLLDVPGLFKYPRLDRRAKYARNRGANHGGCLSGGTPVNWESCSYNESPALPSSHPKGWERAP